MRSLSGNALAKIATAKGTEPVIIVEVNWHGTGILYADKEVSNIPGKILDITNLDAIVNIDSSTDSQEISIVLDDIDGTIKSIIDNYDVHKRNVWVYQWFEGIQLADRFLLFKGKINSPITWNEGERTLSFDVISNIEDNEIGYSAEEGQFENMPNSVVGKPWPMCFGTTTFSSTLRLTARIKGTLADGLSFPDFALPVRESIIQSFSERDTAYYRRLHGYISDTTEFNAYVTRILENAAEQLEKVQETIANQPTLNTTPRIIGGENFPQGTEMYLKIGNTTFSGRMTEDVFTFTDMNQHPNVGDFHTGLSVTDLDRKRILEDNEVYGNKVLPYEDVTYFHVETPPWQEGGRPGYAWGWYNNGTILGDNAGYVTIQPGTQVMLVDLEPQTYVVSIVPGTVLRVSAWAEKEGQRFLQDIDSDNYTVYTETYGDLTVTFIDLHDAISKKVDFTWSDEIFVVFESDVGPNTVDILQYLIETYSDFTVDATTFDAVRTKVENYPSHFAIVQRKELFTVLREIAWQARCSIWLKNGVFFIQYLSEEPTPVATITESDIAIKSLVLTHTPTEDLVTKMTCKWRESGLQEEPYRTILRHNVAKYGTHEENYDFYIYNFVDAVIKSATFWMIRYSNTWKKLQFTTPLTFLNIETFDAVTLDFNSNHVASEDVVAMIENATYNSVDNAVEMECWCPVKAGTLTPYLFAYPAQVDEVATFPTDWETQQSYGGGNSPGGDTTERDGFNLNRDIEKSPLIITYPITDPYNLNNRIIEDNGNPTPSDIGDVHPGTPTVKSATPLGSSVSGTESVMYKGISTETGTPNPAEGEEDIPIIITLPEPDGVEENINNVRITIFWQTVSAVDRPCGGGEFTEEQIANGIKTRVGIRGAPRSYSVIEYESEMETFIFNTFENGQIFSIAYGQWRERLRLYSCPTVGSLIPSHPSHNNYWPLSPVETDIEPLESEFDNGLIGYFSTSGLTAYTENFVVG